jgi:hypothetical protein
MTRQVLRFRVVSAGRGRLTLRVTDRLVDARVVGRGFGSSVPERRALTRTLRMVRTGTGWRVVEVERPQPAR